jgi:hypothetical protein
MARLLKMEVVFLLILTLLGTGLRLYNLGGQGIWHDEMWTLMLAKGQRTYYIQKYQGTDMNVEAFRDEIAKPPSVAPAAVIGEVFRYDAHPPLHYIVVNLFQSVFGSSAFAIRFPSALFGVLTIPFLFLLGKSLHGAELGLVAAGFFAFAPYQIYYAQEARMYSLVVFLSVVSTWLLVDLSFRRQEGRCWKGLARWLSYVAVATAGLYTQYLFVFVLVAHFLFVAARHLHDRAFLSHRFLAMGMSFLVFLPWLVASLFYKNAPPPTTNWLYGKWPVSKLIKAALDKLLGFVWVREIPPDLFRPLWVILFLVGLLAVWRRAALWFLPLWVAVPFAATVFFDSMLGTHASSVSRYFILSSPALYLLVALGIVTLRPRFVSRAVVGAVFVYLAFGGYLTAEGKIPRGDEFWRVQLQFKEAGQKIAMTSKPEDLVVVVSAIPEETSMILAYHMERPQRIVRAPAKDIMKVDWVSLAGLLRGYDQITIVVIDLKVEYPMDFARSIKEGLPFLKFTGTESYKRLHLFRFKEVK